MKCDIYATLNLVKSIKILLDCDIYATLCVEKRILLSKFW